MDESCLSTLDLPGGFSSTGTMLNFRCRLHDEGGVCVVWVDNHVWLTFDADDTAARKLAMVQLSARDLATHGEIAAAFHVGTATVERACRAFRNRGVQGLVPKSRPGRAPRLQGSAADRSILAAARAGQPVRAIAARLGVSRTAVDTSLARSGWTREPKQAALVLEPPGGAAQTETAGPPARGRDVQAEAEDPGCAEPSDTMSSEPGVPEPPHAEACEESIAVPVEHTWDADPSDRCGDRCFARLGFIADAAPLFEDADGVCDIGALLAIPVLAQQGVFAEARRTFDGIGPAFYGLRSVVVCVSLLMVLNLCRLQDVMQREPGGLGRLLGLDRAPEVKTLRRKLRQLEGQNKSLDFMDALARRDLAGRPEIWAYLDGHVAVYTGERKLREHHVAKLRAARPSMIDYWVNQPGGAPLMVIASPPREGLVRQIRTVLRGLGELAPGKVVTIVFDREGWSPGLFAELAANPGVRFLTYRKAGRNRKLRRLPRASFSTTRFEADGEAVDYELADTRVRIGYRIKNRKRVVELRQITLRRPDGKQVQIVTDDFDRPAAELAHRMIHRWSQENCFKYGRAHRGIDEMATRRTEPAPDGQRMVKNPERAALQASIAKCKKQLDEALREHARRALAGTCPKTDRAYIDALTRQVQDLRARSAALPSHVPFADTERGRGAVQPAVEARRLMHTFRMIADRAELALLELVRPHFPDWRHEGRALVRAILHSPGSIRLSGSELHVQIASQASPYKTRALEALCGHLTSMQTVYPGTDKRMVFSVLSGRNPS